MGGNKNNANKDANNISSLLEAVLQKEKLQYDYEKSDADDIACVFHLHRHEEQFKLVVRADLPLVQIILVWHLSDMFDKEDEHFILRIIVNEMLYLLKVGDYQRRASGGYVNLRSVFLGKGQGMYGGLGNPVGFETHQRPVYVKE